MPKSTKQRQSQTWYTLPRNVSMEIIATV